jgi:hypothetical protein
MFKLVSVNGTIAESSVSHDECLAKATNNHQKKLQQLVEELGDLVLYRGDVIVGIVGTSADFEDVGLYLFLHVDFAENVANQDSAT